MLAPGRLRCTFNRGSARLCLRFQAAVGGHSRQTCSVPSVSGLFMNTMRIERIRVHEQARNAQNRFGCCPSTCWQWHSRRHLPCRAALHVSAAPTTAAGSSKAAPALHSRPRHSLCSWAAFLCPGCHKRSCTSTRCVQVRSSTPCTAPVPVPAAGYCCCCHPAGTSSRGRVSSLTVSVCGVSMPSRRRRHAARTGG